MRPSLDEAIHELRSVLLEPGASAVVVAPPGTGKTTLVPLALLREPWLADRRIVLLEPRRLAARAAARRMASLIGEDVGQTVGFRTRDERRVGPGTRIEVVTEGILTRRLQQDPELPGVALVIFDELHERNLTTDLGLALTLDARATIRPDLRVMAMSATLDAGRIAGLLGAPGGSAGSAPATVIEAGEPPHPVEIRWFPRRPTDRLEPATATVVETALRREDGDVLVFLPGAAEIQRVVELLGADRADHVDVYPLYGALTGADQDAALRPSPPGRRRVVVATDIAESSLTVDGVSVVVDSGLAKSPRFDPRTGLTRLRTGPVSKASTDQRAGRAGRQGPGVVYRLWSKGEQATRRSHHEPEILSVDLSGLMLELAAWGSPPESLPFLDQPPVRAVADARALLVLLGALDEHGRLTDLGRRMNTLPLHPRLARMVTIAAGLGPSDATLACALAVLLDERDLLRGAPNERPAEAALRLSLLADHRMRHALADGRAIASARQRLGDLAGRVGASADLSMIAPAEREHRAGPLLALAYPDRLAIRRNQPGRFQLPSGAAAWVAKDDPLAGVPFLVVPDLDGDRREARIRLGAPIDPADVGRMFGEEVTTVRTVDWERRRDELVERVERRIGGITIEETTSKPEPGPEVVGLLLERVRAIGLARALGWSDRARNLRARVETCHRHLGEPWPDWSDDRLLATLDDWLAPFLLFATSRADLEALDVAEVLSARLDHQLLRSFEALAPETLTVPTGRRVLIDYSSDTPVLAVKVQDMYGTATTPTLGNGRIPLLLHLLSPAGRPVQITGDLGGFWAGSWRDVRKEMAGRYPKHSWPENPATAPPGGRTR